MAIQLHETIWWWGFSNAGALGNAEYPFIAIAPGSHCPRVVAPDRVLSLSQIELNPPLHLGVVAIEKEAFGSPGTTVRQPTDYVA